MATTIRNLIKTNTGISALSPNPTAIEFIKNKLGPRAAFVLQQGARCYKPSCNFPYKPHVFNGQKVSPIVIGGLKDLSFYNINGAPERLASYMKIKDDYTRDRFYKNMYSGLERFLFEPLMQNGCKTLSMPFLDSYLLIPTPSGKLVFVCDDHNHAAFAWAMAREAGIIQSRAALLHIDKHLDNSAAFALERNHDFLLKDVASHVLQFVELCSFIHFGVFGMTGSEPLIDEKHVYYFTNDDIGGTSFYPTYFFLCGGNVKTKELDGFRVSLSCADKAISRARQANKSLIADIDLDFFLNHFSPEGLVLKNGHDFNQSLDRVIQIARQADFVTIATSPGYFLVNYPQNVMAWIINYIVSAL